MAASVRESHPRLHVVVSEEREMVSKFGVEFAIERIFREDRAQASEQTLHPSFHDLASPEGASSIRWTTSAIRSQFFVSNARRRRPRGVRS